MATFNKGESYKNQRVHITNAFEQTAPKGGYNVAISRSNDLAEQDKVDSGPMLVYDNYIDDGVSKNSYTAEYSKSQMDAMNEIANKEGDNYVIVADLMPNSKGPGLIINTKKMSTPEEKFDKAVHVEKTNLARENNAKAREDAKLAKEQEVEAETEELEV